MPRTSRLPIRGGTLGLEIRTYAGPPTFLLSDPVLQLPAPVAHQRTDMSDPLGADSVAQELVVVEPVDCCERLGEPATTEAGVG